MTTDELKEIGFKDMPNFTVMGSLIYDLGRNRHLSVGCVGTPNEMVFICSDSTQTGIIEEVIVLKNYDYDGFTSIETIKELVKLLKSK